MPSALQYRTVIFIPFHLSDPAGIVFFGHLFSLAHEGWERCLVEQLNLSWKEWFQHPEWIVPIRHATADYYTPLYAGQSCDVILSIIKGKRSSMSIESHFFQEERRCSIVKTVHVFCDRKSGMPCPVPPLFSNLFNSLSSD